MGLPEHLKNVYMSSTETLSEDQQEKLIELLLKYKSLCAASNTDPGYLSAVTHKVNTGTTRPVHQPVQQTPLGFQGDEEQHLREMLEAGVVVPSSSEWASPVPVVQKKDGGFHWCVDYGHLNGLTLTDAYLLPKKEE